MALGWQFWQSQYAQLEIVPDFSSAYGTYELQRLDADGFFTDAWWLVVQLHGVSGLTVPGRDKPRSVSFGDEDEGYYRLHHPDGDKSATNIRGPRRCPDYFTGNGNRGNKISFPYVKGLGTVSFFTRAETSGPASTGPSELVVYQPRSWYGSPTAVIGSILRSMGMPYDNIDDYIDLDSFSGSDWGQLALGFEIYYRREVGQSLGNTIMALVRHTWDLLTVTMSGRIAIYSRALSEVPFAHHIDGLDTTDGVLDVAYDYTTEHLANKVRAGYGRWVEDSRIDHYIAPFEFTLISHREIKLLANPEGYAALPTSGLNGPWIDYENAESLLRYGEARLTNINTGTGRYTHEMEKPHSRDRKGRPIHDYTSSSDAELPEYHLPYLSSEAQSANWAAAACEQAMTIYFERLDKDSKIRRELRVVQDMRGLDYDCGWWVRSIEVTHDQQVIGEAHCIGKIVNFRDFTVTSTLLEEPA